MNVAQQLERNSELTIKNTLLQAALHNISQGVLVVDQDYCVASWNDSFLDIANMAPSQLRTGDSIGSLLHVRPIHWLYNFLRLEPNPNQSCTFCVDEVGDGGRVWEIRLSPMPGGGFVSTYTDISERKSALQANASKTRFLAAASHDLLQPLTAARFFAAALAESRLPERNRSLVTNLTFALNAVDELLTALLDISRFDAGAYVPEIVDFPLERILRLLVDEHSHQAKLRQLSLHWVSCNAVVRSDPLLVSRVLRNFLSNAFRYTPAGRVLVGCRRRPGGIELQVWDTGIGVPEDKLITIFQEFQRLNTNGQGRGRGVGLGLAIVDRIARHLGHPISVRSQLGKGSVFGMLLPYGDPAKAQPPTEAGELPALLDRVAGTTVMVIDDDPDELAGMMALLRSWRCDVSAVDHLDTALRRIRRSNSPPQIIVADYRLGDGQRTLQTLRSLRAVYRRPVPAIILTADRTDEVQEAIRGAGFHLLDKPLKPARLRSLLAHLATQG